MLPFRDIQVSTLAFRTHLRSCYYVLSWSIDLDPTVKIDVLKAGHHGSCTSGSSAFLNAVTPEVVIISLGAGNSYGHPHQEALDRISASGAQYLLRTDIDGTITLSSDGGGNYSF